MKEPTFKDAVDGVKGIIRPFKELYDKGCELEKEIREDIKDKNGK